MERCVCVLCDALSCHRCPMNPVVTIGGRALGGGFLPSALSACQLAGSGGKFGWSWKQWLEQAEQWPAPRSGSRWSQISSQQLSWAPCHHNWRGEKKQQREASTSDKCNGTKSLFVFPKRAATWVSRLDTKAQKSTVQQQIPVALSSWRWQLHRALATG